LVAVVSWLLAWKRDFEKRVRTTETDITLLKERFNTVEDKYGKAINSRIEEERTEIYRNITAIRGQLTNMKYFKR